VTSPLLALFGRSMRMDVFWSTIPFVAFLSAIMSLDLKHGSLPLSFFVAFYLLGTVAGAAGGEALPLFAIVFLISFSLGFYSDFGISARLEAMAARD
jgi:hypothetical protein